MLAIRFLRSGRRNRAFFRIVLTEKSRPPKSNFIKELGWFDPHSKEASLKTEEILKYLDNGAKPSNSVSKLLIANKIKHKQIVFVPDAPKSKKNDNKTEAVNKEEVTTEEILEENTKTDEETATEVQDEEKISTEETEKIADGTNAENDKES